MDKVEEKNHIDYVLYNFATIASDKYIDKYFTHATKDEYILLDEPIDSALTRLEIISLEEAALTIEQKQAIEKFIEAGETFFRDGVYDAVANEDILAHEKWIAVRDAAREGLCAFGIRDGWFEMAEGE